MLLYQVLVSDGRDVLHTAIWVDDIDTQLDFYCDGLGLKQTHEFDLDGVTNTYVAGESDTEIQFKHDDTERNPEPTGIDHLAVEVADMVETIETVVEDPRTIEEMGIRIMFVTDPEGYVVELIETLEA